MFEVQKGPISQEKTESSSPVFAPPATKNMTTSLRSWGENSWRKLLHMFMHSLKIIKNQEDFHSQDAWEST